MIGQRGVTCLCIDQWEFVGGTINQISVIRFGNQFSPKKNMVTQNPVKLAFLRSAYVSPTFNINSLLDKQKKN